jgi:hypothetical protein
MNFCSGNSYGFKWVKSRPSLRAGGLIREGLLRDPFWENLATIFKSRPSLRAGGLLNVKGNFKQA